MRETLEALNSLGFSVGQPEMAPQSEPRDGFSNPQEKMSSRDESTLHSCSGPETPGQKEGIHTEQAEAPCMGSQACIPQKAEPASSVPDHMKFHCSLMRKHVF
ncbi:similar to zinc finger protein EZI, isoform CRA_b [Rattus norvegicus]|uniref:Similar to zinc finger protein EZI, isoform CRA_b n=1 Tax=Rattus norvegicus TaxID=10116 RepID=A6K0E5_RAT|nr:similar to zinc finger protein EZI, isoform CRA_b [Rattus norvegicus]EDL88273.1 similar to zinc finger protein EZI, isoform CRA_b [Rattus norvegicus]